eukprot:9623780-Ditylum_brightwellii.AAC.1
MGAHCELLTVATTRQKESKTKVLFVVRPSHSYTDSPTFDNTDFSPPILDDSKFTPSDHQFCYLGSIATSGLKDSTDINNCIKRPQNHLECFVM